MYRLYLCRKVIIAKAVFIMCLFFFKTVAAKESMPNVLLVTIDACRPDHLSCYGYKRNTTPNIKKLANQSVLFTNAFSQSAWTTPAMISIFTSLYPFTHNVDYRGKHLMENVVTLPKVLKKNGYAVPVLPRFVNIPNYWYLGFDVVKDNKFTVSREEELPELIEEYKDQRFFIWYHYNGVHLPYNPPHPYDKMFLTDNDLKMMCESKALSLIKNKVIIKHNTVDFRAEDKHPIIALYDAQLRQLDDYIGHLVERMKFWDILENTIIIITADHGEELLDHGFVGHASTSLNATLYDEIIRIPLIIRYPKKLRKKKINAHVQQIDLMPTIIELLGVSLPNNLHGNSLLPLIEGKSAGNSMPVYCESNKGGYQTTENMKGVKIRCIRTEHWKLISTTNVGKERYELYDLMLDPAEKENVIIKYPNVAAKLKKKLYMKIRSGHETKYKN